MFTSNHSSFHVWLSNTFKGKSEVEKSIFFNKKSEIESTVWNTRGCIIFCLPLWMWVIALLAVFVYWHTFFRFSLYFSFYYIFDHKHPSMRMASHGLTHTIWHFEIQFACRLTWFYLFAMRPLVCIRIKVSVLQHSRLLYSLWLSCCWKTVNFLLLVYCN